MVFHACKKLDPSESKQRRKKRQECVEQRQSMTNCMQTVKTKIENGNYDALFFENHTYRKLKKGVLLSCSGDKRTQSDIFELTEFHHFNNFLVVEKAFRVFIGFAFAGEFDLHRIAVKRLKFCDQTIQKMVCTLFSLPTFSLSILHPIRQFRRSFLLYSSSFRYPNKNTIYWWHIPANACMRMLIKCVWEMWVSREEPAESYWKLCATNEWKKREWDSWRYSITAHQVTGVPMQWFAALLWFYSLTSKGKLQNRSAAIENWTREENKNDFLWNTMLSTQHTIGAIHEMSFHGVQ